MTFLSLNLEHLRLPEFLGEPPVNRATWLCLLGYSVNVENGGRIAGCRRWKTRMWEQCCGVTSEEVLAESALWRWEGDDLIVWDYPHEIQASLNTKRSNGRFGILGGRPPKNTTKTQRETQNNPVLESGLTHPETRKVREGKVTEGNETDSASVRETVSPMSLPEAQVFAKRWCESSASMTGYDAGQVELWFADRERKQWESSAGQMINTKALAEKDLTFWLLRNKTGGTLPPPGSEGRGVSFAEKKGGGAGGAVHPLEVPPCEDWKALYIKLAEEAGAADSDWLAWLDGANWHEVAGDDRQAIVNAAKRRREGGAA